MRKQLYPILFGGFSLKNYLRSVDGSYYDFTNLSTLSQDNAGATPVTTIGDPIGRVVDTINARNGVQATGTLKGTYQTTGDKFDGSDDNLLTSYLAGAGSNFIVALVTVPATISAVQLCAGASTGASGRLYVGFNTDGTVAGGVGSQNNTVIKGTVDRRNTTVVVGISQNGSLVRLFADQGVEYEAAQSGSVTTSIPFMLGAFNGNGAAGGFFGGSIKRLVAGKDFLTPSRFQQIRSSMLAA